MTIYSLALPLSLQSMSTLRFAVLYKQELDGWYSPYFPASFIITASASCTFSVSPCSISTYPYELLLNGLVCLLTDPLCLTSFTPAETMFWHFLCIPQWQSASGEFVLTKNVDIHTNNDSKTRPTQVVILLLQTRSSQTATLSETIWTTPRIVARQYRSARWT